ncbi:amidohydrolase family protein (plasmid) [Nicoliella spurrieriana]|uniref:Amidohydrolase family protein n=1 Tax=Nicoliella spurrieriana TaxID=2925830 RepID=A0A976RQM6_9LACO|nr:amidohydrolase family protein [Nicoliella spurrieriana]UQS86036.1 amidohydrolase family protein [Nicoliella spurrieriana]
MSETTYSNFNLYDGETDHVTANSWMTVDDDTGKLVKVGTGDGPSDSVDLHNKYVMPGLINAHTHITMDEAKGDGGTDVNKIRMTVRSEKHLHQLLESGVTYIRECGSCYDEDITLNQLAQLGELTKVPHILPSGKPYSMTGGHGDLPNFAHLVDSPDAMRHAVRKGLKKGAMSIKIMATGGVMTEGDNMVNPQLSVEEMKVAVDEAHHKGRIVAAHAEGNPGIMNAIKAGVDSVEHGFYVNDEEIEMMLKQGTYLTPTLIAGWGVAELGKGKLPDWELKKMQDAMDDAFANVKNAWQKGVPVTLGTDAGTPFNDFFMTPDELALMVAHEDVTPFEALQTSFNSAKLMGVDQEYGSLKPGKYADFLVLDANPLADVRAVKQRDKQVYLAGKREY